ncbi:lipopolysaccharide biosynthesis protein [Fodinibius salsisoli]|uniref:Lipopolysaccharide biosynthesis protein n=1 Tax=Fodinibius salsisoli TaxID=2820877 RepID=A0ABT3PTH8_9BACT|nr:lipopolysaccharide biosynthesis protein [Fodinibius salsisoli]MCW9709139.1 lipopolysaccharide biosynthesis protein [Fodinibius salsisoli]
MASLTDKTLSGFIWAFGERFGVQLLQMVVFIVLARKIAPEAFGLMGMLAVFIAVSQSLTDSGFGQALIQKKETDEIDYSSVFYINLIVSIVIYGLLFVTAPLIASFYGESILINLIRVLGLKFIIAAFSMVQIARLTKEVQFKKLMMAKLPSTLLGGAAGIGAAYGGLGVWSLIIQQLTDSTAYSIQIWIQSKWRPILVFDWQRVKELFDFGSKIMIEGVLSRIYTNFYEVMIGRYFSTAQVGFYTQANKIKQLPVQNISNALRRVTFPILSEIQTDDMRLKRAYKKIVRQLFLVIAPIMVGAIVLAEPLFRFVLTEKWLPAVPYFQWLCISGLFYPASAYNLNILKVKGRSDLFLYVGLVKKGIAVLGILIFVQYSVIALVIFRVFQSLLSYFINSYYSGKFIAYGVFEQIQDIWCFLFLSALMGGAMWGITSYLALGDLLTLIVGTVTGVIVYLSLLYQFEREIMQYSINTVKEFISK